MNECLERYSASAIPLDEADGWTTCSAIVWSESYWVETSLSYEIAHDAGGLLGAEAGGDEAIPDFFGGSAAYDLDV